MANPLEVNAKFDVKNFDLKDNHTNVNANLFECAYSPQQTIGHFIQVQRELIDISHAKWTQRDVGEIKDIYSKAKETYGASKESVGQALRDRAKELNETLEKKHSGLRVEVSVGKGKGYGDGSYTFKVVDVAAGKTVGMVRFGDPKSQQEIEVISTDK
jgi:hypothetical protein